MPRVYLAGPTVFRSDMAELFADMKRLCAEHGLEAVAPVDGGPPPETAEPGRAAFIRCANIALTTCYSLYPLWGLCLTVLAAVLWRRLFQDKKSEYGTNENTE